MPGRSAPPTEPIQTVSFRHQARSWCFRPVPGSDCPIAGRKRESVRFVEEDGTWVQVAQPTLATRLRGRPGLFLDRDGVLVEDVGYLCRPADLRPIAGGADVILAANRRDIAVVIVTNQSGIGRGFYGWDDFAATQERLDAVLAAQGARIDMTIACPHHPEGKQPYRHPAHPCRKPRPGMVFRALDRLALDRERSWIVGDRVRDLEAGRRAGLAGGLHVGTGDGAKERDAARALAGPAFQVLTLTRVRERQAMVISLSR